MRKVMIGTPSYDGRIDVCYTNSLCNTIRESPEWGVEVLPIWVSYDALIQRARNDTIHLAITMGCDDLVFIDSDIEWQPEWFFRLLNYDVDVVGGTYPKKGDHEEYVVRKINNTDIDRTTGLLEVDGLGTGFIRLSKRAIQHLWDTSEPYVDKKDNLERRMVFDVVIIDHDMVSEDILMCMKLQDGGFKIYLDPTMTCNHIGTKKYTGDFKHWYNTLLRPSTIRKQL